MAIDSVASIALSGLQTAQAGITTVSNNITNVNTPGYVRENVQQSPLVAAGVGEGVTVDSIQRVTNQFLESANYNAAASAGSANVISNLLTQAQGAFGDPSQATSYLNQLSTVFSDFTAAANDPASNLPRSQTIDDLNNFLDTTQTVANSLSGITTQANAQIGSDVSQVNQLLSQINTLNTAITGANASGGDASASQDSQSQLLQQLSSLIQINVSTQTNGTTVVRSSNGALLTGNGDVASLTFTPSQSGLNSIQITTPNTNQSSTLQVGDGELQGLLSLTNNTIPGVQAQLSQYVSGAAAAINAAHNANTAVPPPQTLTGRNTGLDLPTIIGDFTGATNIAVVNASGVLQQQVQLNFSNDTLSVNGGAAVGFTPANFLTSLNTALGGTATATFSNGALSISATTAGSGVAIQDVAGNPSQDGGQSFSQFFGLNDLITSNTITNFNTGLKATDASGFTPGGTISFQLGNASGAPIGNVTVTVPPATQPTMQDLINQLNSAATGVGQYGAFSLSSTGALTFTPSTPGTTLSVVGDTTQRGAGGVSLTQLFGLGTAQQGSLATTFQVRPDIEANPQNLALGQLDLSAAAGTPVVAVGDGSGGTLLANVANKATNFAAAGGFPAQTTSVTQYAANLAGNLGQQASAAASANTAATAVQNEAQTRLQSVEGVNLDEELVNLTTYQQAYNASARLVQASKNMIDTLLDVVP
jgi:flagellar hook-associated protein 1 FlgK